MSQLANARRQANSIRTLMRQAKYLPAAQALHDALVVMLKTPLMKGEREEMERLIQDGTFHIMNDPMVRRSVALELKYVPGQERDLLENLRIIIDVFQESMQEEAENAYRQIQERREQEMARGQALLDEQDVAGARTVFAAVAKEAGEDSEVMADIGERFLNAKQYSDAAAYLGNAITLSPDSAHIYNSLAMAMRKLGQYAEAEKCYLKAAQNGYKDSHLLFNMGRLYADWQQWEKAVKAARGALALDPGFTEAKQLMVYAERKMSQG